MTKEELVAIIAEVQKYQSELDDVEAKSAQQGTPQRLYESFSAFANRTGGGILLLGLDENNNFQAAGVKDAHRLQEQLSDIAASQMEPALRPEFSVFDVEGKTIVALEISEVPAELKPCYYKTAGLQKGSYIRVGNTDRQMSDYEIFGYISARSQPMFDEEPVKDATMDDLEKSQVEKYLSRLRSARKQASYLELPREELLTQLRIVRDVDGVKRPTLAGLLMFGKHPQRFEPQIMITFLQYYGITETEKTPRGERFLDNQKFEGNIPEMIEAAVNHVLASIRKSSLIEGLYRRDIPEYPEEVIREAVVNAAAHRDYSHFVRGSYIQIRLFADRLEIQSPGGLYGNVTEDTLDEEQSTRNRLLMRLMEDVHLVENRGSGVRTMVESMRKANLEPPHFQDKRASFWVVLHAHTLMNPEAIAWLNQFARREINDHQRVALVLLRHHGHMTNSDYQRLNHVDSVTANRELRALVQLGLIEQHSTRRWAHYTLNVPSEIETPVKPQTQEERVLGYVRERGAISNAECCRLLGLASPQAWYLLKKMHAQGLLKRQGEKRWSRYILP